MRWRVPQPGDLGFLEVLEIKDGAHNEQENTEVELQKSRSEL